MWNSGRIMRLHLKSFGEATGRKGKNGYNGMIEQEEL
jgi:hypothetical protein